MRAKVFVVAITAACLGYTLLSIERMRAFAQSGDVVGFLLAIAVGGVIAIASVLILREIRFGQSMAAMARILEQESALPADDLPRTAAGRVEQVSADARFEEFKAVVQADDLSWRNWYRLAIAYDDARDRKRARYAMRRAERLFRSD